MADHRSKLPVRARRLAVITAVTTTGALAVAAPAFATGSGGGTSSASLGSATITENFDSLAASGTAQALPTGVRFLETGTSSAADGAYAVGDGTSNAGNVYSFGTGAATDRALGSLASGTNSPTLGYAFTNTSGAPLAGFTVSLTGEQWRTGGSGNLNTLTAAYRVGDAALDAADFTAVPALNVTSRTVATGSGGALDGNAPANRQALSATVTAPVPAGATVVLRFADANDVGSDDGLAIDDLSVTPMKSATPPPVAMPEVPLAAALPLLGLGAFGAVTGLRRRRSGRATA